MGKENIINLLVYKDRKEAQQDLRDIHAMGNQAREAIPLEGNVYEAADYFNYRQYERTLERKIKVATTLLHFK